MLTYSWSKSRLTTVISFFFGFFIAGFLSVNNAQCDVLYVHDYSLEEYMLGGQDARMLVGYAKDRMFIDKKTRFTGSLMTRLFGEVKEDRQTSKFLIGSDKIVEIDWNKGSVLVYPFEKMSDIEWITRKDVVNKHMAESIDSRYKVSKPVLSVKIDPVLEMVEGYLCSHVKALLRLETTDLKKDAKSVTLVVQDLWVSTAVPGFDEYNSFHEKLSTRMGLDALRLGNMSYLLQYWDEPLDEIRKSLENVKGYPVKGTLTVEAKYIIKPESSDPAISSMQVKKEAMILQRVEVTPLDEAFFTEPPGFGSIEVK